VTEAADEYRRLYSELLFARELDGGDLSQEEEAHRCGQLTDLWNEMTEEEQASFERDLVSPSPGLPYSDNPLGDPMTDMRTVLGTGGLPRQPAEDASDARRR